jgi:hypothetical protein
LRETKDGGWELDGDFTVCQEAAEVEEPTDGSVGKCESGLTKDLEASSAEELGPRIANEEHFSNGVHQSDVLDQQACLVNALEICQRSKPKAAKSLASEDYFSASLLTEAHLGDEGVV